MRWRSEHWRKSSPAVNALARVENGHATLLHAPMAIKSKAGEMEHEQIDRAMQLRVKQAFDPSGVFVPGRLVGGI